MNRFIKSEISEKDFFELTPPTRLLRLFYACPALVLEEYRRKGITKQLCISGIENIRKKHPIKAAFVWAFSKEGDLDAETIARLAGLPLYKKI